MRMLLVRTGREGKRIRGRTIVCQLEVKTHKTKVTAGGATRGLNTLQWGGGLVGFGVGQVKKLGGN